MAQGSDEISFRSLSVQQGLSQNSVVSIAQDSTGYLWFATQDGLNKYDGKQFIFFNKQFEDVTRPGYSKLGKTIIDRDGQLWIVSNSGILEKFNTQTETFSKVKNIKDVSVIFQDHKKDHYIGTFGKGLYKIDAVTKDTIRLFENELKEVSIYDFLESKDEIYIATSEALFKMDANGISVVKVAHNFTNFSAMALSKNETIWMGSFENSLFYRSKQDTVFQRFEHPDLPSALNIQDVMVDHKARLWIATYGNGLYVLNIEANQIAHFTENQNDPFALHYNDVLCLYEDFAGTIWVGTDGAGLSYYDEHLKKFNLITNDQVPKNVSVDVVRAIILDDTNTMWIGTSGKGLTAIHPSIELYKTYTLNNSKLASDRVMSLYVEKGELWIGFQGKGLQIMQDPESFVDFDELKNKTIWKIYRHSEHRVWLCTRDSGLLLFHRKNGILKSYNSANSVLSSNNIRTVEKGSKDDLWIGTEDDGLFKLDSKTDTVEKINAIPDKIKSLYFDGRLLWIGTNGKGLKSYDPKTQTVSVYNKNDGFPNLVIYGILSANHNSLWLSSNKGIFEFELRNGKPKLEIYGKYSGLQAFEFNTGAYYKADDRTLYFGGLDGVNWFKPETLTLNEKPPKTVISKVGMFNKEQAIEKYTNYKHNQNTMTFTYAGLHFSQPERNQYKYMLENHDGYWIDAANNTVAHYTNLPPNDYTFKVISSNYDGFWNQDPATYNFSVLKPWYFTNTMKVIYVFLLLLLIYSIYKYLEFRWHVKTQLQLEHAETERLQKLDDFKTKFYTNISHEFRTPLTLISGPIDHQLSKRTLEAEDRKELNLVKQNASRLLNLVNQMLDLSLIDAGQLQLKVQKGNLKLLFVQIVEAFQYKANEKNIQIERNINGMDCPWYDRDLVEKLTSNLLSNAIKYAPEHSNVIFDANEKDGVLVMSIINEHEGANKANFSKLFQRFYQDNMASEGVGVGLALVRELVNLSKGSIIVTNLDTDKIQFTVTLPIVKDAFLASEIKSETTKEEISGIEEHSKKVNQDRALVLIVEDDKDIRNFVTSIFKNTHQTLTAANGKIGVELALKHIPDVIVSDIMMPELDGIELCNRLKYNELTSHIPIILLTAKVGEAHEIQGLKTGADAYITKPFSSEKLKLRVQKLIENRKQLQKHYSKDLNIDPDVAITSTEAEFLKRLKSVLDEELTNPEFTSEAFAKAMHMGRTQLHRKLKALFDSSTSAFIRAQRLKLAAQLLKASDASVSEIAYQVGFNTPSYFIKCFKQIYQCIPSEFDS